MCGIIGYSGTLDAAPLLVRGLEQLEYRGYDSAGIAIQTLSGTQTIKTAGNVSSLKKKVAESHIPESHCGIGHTRWATHGGVSDTNAHPHTRGKVTLIHNGIIENYKDLAYTFGRGRKPLISQTDTEIAAMVIDYYYETLPADKAIWKALSEIEGSYAFCIMFADIPDTVYCIRKVSPLVAALTRDGSLVASDVTALINYTQNYFVLPESTLLILNSDSLRLENADGTPVAPEMLHVDWDITSAQKNGYPHFMLKEIYEQPEALLNTITPRIVNGMPDFTEDGIPDSVFEKCNQIRIVACGTAMHAGLVGKALIEKRAKLPVTVEIASEFRYQSPIIDEKTLTIVISQSGETIDTLASLRLAKECGSSTLAIVNVKGSTIARESEYVLYTHAGPEIAVASTKAYTVQLAALSLIAMRLAFIRNSPVYDKVSAEHDIAALKEAVSYVKDLLSYNDVIRKLTLSLKDKSDLFFIGRGLDYALSCEGSIKLKEISYIHSEAYAAGELKHGTISLITDSVPVIALATQEHVFSKMISNIREVRARGALVILITQKHMEVEPSICDYHLTIPDIADEFAPIPTAVILQLIAYHTSVHRGLNVDQPRNLAKSVTVE